MNPQPARTPEIWIDALPYALPYLAFGVVLSLKGEGAHVGWALAQITEVPYWRLALWNSLFAGMLIFFVFRHEIPSPLEGRFVPLLLGAVGYSLLALVLELL